MQEIDVRISKCYMFKMDAQTFWLRFLGCYTFYVIPNCIINHHEECEIIRIIVTYLNWVDTDVIMDGQTELHFREVSYS